MDRKQEKAMWAKSGKGFGLRYGWKTPDGTFHVISKTNIPESLRPIGGVSLSNGRILDLKSGKIGKASTLDKCSWCDTVFDTKKHNACPNKCQNVIRRIGSR